MSDFDLGPIRGLRPDERDDAPVASLGEMWNKTWEDTRKVQNFDAHLFNYSNAFDGIADRVKAATGEALDNPFRSASAGQSVEMLTTFSREAVEGSALYAQWRQRAQELKAKHADKLDWDALLEEPGRVAWESMKKAREEADALSERVGMVNPRDVPLVGGIPVLNAAAALGANLVRHPQYTATQLAAGFAAQMLSPADAAMNFIPFGAGRLAGGAAKSIIKNATANALTNIAGQALLSAPKQLSYQSAGLPYGWQVWADEVGAAAGAGFMLDAAIRTPARAAIRRFGRDTAPGTTFSRNTERGGILFDAIEDATPTARPRLEIDPETIRKAEAGDIAASRTILEQTGAMEDPAVKYAVEHMEAGGKLTDDVLNLLEREMGVARPDGMKALAAAMQGRYLDSIPEPTREAPEPLMHEQGAVVLDRVEAVSGAMERLPAQVRQAVQDGLDAGIPRIVRAVQQILDDTPDRVPERIIEAVVPLLDERTVAEARLHSGRSGPIELAQTIRRFPDLIDSNADLDAQHIAMARTIAGMDDVAYADVARGTVPAEVAVLVADRVPRAAQARVLSDLQRAEPKSVAEAADLIEAIAPPRRVPGTEGQLAPGARIDDPAGPAAKARTEALRQEAGQAYVDAMEPIQRRDAIEDELKKLRGQLIKGKPEEASGEAKGGEGEATGPGAIRKQIEALEREHAVLQAQITPGPEGYELARLAMRAIDVRREADITAAVNDALRLGRQITPEGTRIEALADESMTARAANGTTVLLDGTSDPATGHIRIALSALDPSATMGHEAVHTLVTLGHLSPAEVDALSSLAREAGTFTKDADYRKAYEGRDGLDRIIAEEAAASYIEARIKGDVKGPENAIVERIRQLLERIRTALARQGFQSREDVVQAILSGDAARREARADWRRDAVIQGAASEQTVRGGDQLFALADRDVGQSMRRSLDSLGHYSQALEAAKSWNQKKGTPEQALMWLKKSGVKDAEIEATRLKGFLDGKKSVTQEEVVGHLEANRVSLTEFERIETLDSPSGRTGLGNGFALFPLTDAVKKSVIEDGQPLFALRDLLPRGRDQGRRALGAYRDSNVLTSDDLPGRFTWKSPPKQGKVQMFHATNRSFDRFDMGKSQDFGIHFGTQEQAWNRVLNTDRVEGSRVIPANVEFSKAIVLPDLMYWGPAEMARTLADRRIIDMWDPAVERLFEMGDDINNLNGRVSGPALRWIVNEANDAIKAKLNEAGIDAIWYRNNAEGDGWSLLVWNEGQVRNTITGDLLYAMADEPPVKSDMAFVDRMNRMGELIAACRG